MRYLKPFTPSQRKTALAVYKSMRVTYDNMRFHFRPLDLQQRHLMKEYRQAVLNFARVLRSENAKMDVARLNETEERSIQIFISYSIARYGSEGSRDE